MRINFKKSNLIYIISFLFGIITPFVTAIIVIEFFYIGIFLPFLLVISVLILLVNIINNKKKNFFSKETTKIAFVLPIFIFSQILSSFIVDKIQRFRSNLIISKIQNKEIEISSTPKRNIGIEYQKLKNNDFVIKYGRGFFVTEIYYDSEKEWKSYGWND